MKLIFKLFFFIEIRALDFINIILAFLTDKITSKEVY